MFYLSNLWLEYSYFCLTIEQKSIHEEVEDSFIFDGRLVLFLLLLVGFYVCLHRNVDLYGFLSVPGSGGFSYQYFQ
jgi:hypothetical protein